MMNLIPRKSPELLCNPIDEEYGYAVNCSYPNSFRVLNKSQYAILQAINGEDDVLTIAHRFNMPVETLQQFLAMLQKTEIVTFGKEFTVPQKPALPNALNFWIHTTNACNLGCSYCYISTLNSGKAMAASVQQQLILKLVQVARVKAVKHVKLRLAGGEPLGQFNTWKMFIPAAKAALSKEGCKLDAAFITNLTILNNDIIEFSKQQGISYGVSIDGVEAVHNATRNFRTGKGSFKLVDTNIRMVINAGISVSVNTVVSNHNLRGLPALTQYLIDLDIPFRYSIVKGENIDGLLLDQYLSASYSIMLVAIEKDWKFSKRYQFCDLKPNELGFQTCASGFSGGAIYVDGSFKYCHVHFGKDTGEQKSIFNQDADLVDMIQTGEHLENIKSADCKECRFRSVCTSGCPVYRIDGKDPQCSLYHRYIPLYYELQGKERLRLMQQYAIV
jgi:uncharacterized protein